MKIEIDYSKWQVNANRGSARFFNQEKEAELKKQVDLYLELGVIQRSQSLYHSQVHLVPKPDGSHRLVIDYRNFNNTCNGMGWPLPTIQSMMERLGSKRPRTNN